MPDRSKWSESISVGFQVFAQGGDEEFGAIRDVCAGGRDEFLVNIENGGDHCAPLAQQTGLNPEPARQLNGLRVKSGGRIRVHRRPMERS